MTVTLTEHKSGAKHLHATDCPKLHHPLFKQAIVGVYPSEYEAEAVYEISNEMGTTTHPCVPKQLRIGRKLHAV